MRALDLDFERGVVRRNGERVEIAPRSAELLALLVAQQGRLVSREEIRKALWKDGVFVDFDRSVNIYVNQLRKAFRDDARRPRYIETVPRQGYRFIAPVERKTQPAVVVLVLPFEGLDDDPPQAAVADGATEELILHLGRLNPAELRVIARTTALRYRGTEKNLRKIADELSVDYIVEGTVRRIGRRTRIGVHLIDAARQTQLWADSFEDELSEVVSTQSQVARAIATQIELLHCRVAEGPGASKTEGAAPDTRRRIAVLPFLDRDRKKDLDYLCVGIADEIIGALGRLPGVRVASRSSSFRFKGVAIDPREIGRLLGVELILEGSVRRVRNRLRITVQLVSARDGCCVRSQRYDCGEEDVFDIQENIARDFAAALRVEPVEGEGALVLRDTRNPAAYHMYLRARHAWYHRYAGGIQRAIDYFQRAAELDPAYTSAHAGLADCYVVLGTYGFLPPAIGHRQALAAAEKAMSLDAEHPAALGSRAAVHFYYEWNWQEAERKLRRAVELAPEIVELRTTYGLLLTFLKCREAGMSNMRSALGIDPLSPYANSTAALNHLSWGEAELAKVHCDRALEVDADFLLAWIMRAAAMAKSGEHGGAIALLDRLAERSDRASYALGWLGWALACGGERERAKSVRRELVARRAVAYVPSLFIAWVEAALGEREEARKNLALAVKERHPMLLAHTLPVFDPLWADPDVASLLDPCFPK